MTDDEHASIHLSRFKLSGAMLGSANLLAGLIAAQLWDPTSKEWSNFLMLAWGMGVSVGVSILLLVFVLQMYQTRVENERWTFYSLIMTICILFSFLLPTLPVALWSWWRFRSWCKARTRIAKQD